MALDPIQLGTLLEPSNRAWAELGKATLNHRNGWVVLVEEVRFRPPYCTLVTRGVKDGVLREFNTEALARGAFTVIGVDPGRAEVIMHVLTNAIRLAEEAKQRANEEERKLHENRRQRQTAEAAIRVTRRQAEEEAATARLDSLLRAQEDHKRAELRSNAKRLDDWRNCLAARSITRVTHFTRLQNLRSILEHGLWPVTAFVDLREQPVRNDDKRFDGHLDKVSLSITHPNDALFFKWHADTYQDQAWVVISLDPSVLWELPCLLFPANAARAGGRTAITHSNAPLAADFEQLFAEPTNGTTRVQLGHAPTDTTDPQAEVMISVKIAPTYFQSIAVFNAVDHQRVTDVAKVVSNVPVRVDRSLFDMRRCASEFRRAQRAIVQSQRRSTEVALMVVADDFDDDLPF